MSKQVANKDLTEGPTTDLNSNISNIASSDNVSPKVRKATQIQDADIADQMSMAAPDVDTFIFVQERRNKQEFGLLAPQKGVSCTPDGTSIQFLKLMKDYLEQSKTEMNYIEAKRA